MSFEDDLRGRFAEAAKHDTLGSGSLSSVKARARQRTIRTRVATGAAVVALALVGGIATTSLIGNARQVDTFDDTETPDDDGAAENPQQDDDDDENIVTTGNVSEDDFTYIGSFRVPSDPSANDGPQRFDFGGFAMAVDTQGDPDNDAGSIFMSGFPIDGQVAEITIPEPVPHSGDAANLPVAEFLQPFTDITDGRAETLLGTDGDDDRYRIGGLEVVDGPGGRRLHWTVYEPFGIADRDNPGHGHSSLDLSNPDPEGPWFLGGLHNHRSGGYVFAVPEEFADGAFGGRQLISGFREQRADNSASSPGSPFFAFTPPESADAGSRVGDPLTLADYERPDQQVEGFRIDAVTRGASWVSTSDNRNVVVTVGNANGLPDVDCVSEGQPPLDFFGPEVNFYDPDSLAEVARGNVEPHTIAPYMRWDPSEHLLQTCALQLSAVSFDALAGRLYLVQLYAETVDSEFGFLPVVHVFDIG